MKWKSFALTLPLTLLAGCGEATAPAPAKVEADVAASPVPAAVSHRFAAWTGKWVGVEGMYAVVTLAEPGRYRLEMQSDLDTKGSYDGADSAAGIAFTRGDEAVTLRAGSGDDTGLKYLAGKNDCLVVSPGEGYCRD